MSDLALIRKEFVKQVLQEEEQELHDNQGKAIASLVVAVNKIMAARGVILEEIRLSLCSNDVISSQDNNPNLQRIK